MAPQKSKSKSAAKKDGNLQKQLSPSGSLAQEQKPVPTIIQPFVAPTARSEHIYDYGSDDDLLSNKMAERGSALPTEVLGLVFALQCRDHEADSEEWENAHKTDPSAGAEDIYSDTDGPSDQQAQDMNFRKRREGFDQLRFEDQEIYDAWERGPESVKRLRNQERRGILNVYGKPPKRTITEEDLEVLYRHYEKLFAAPGHKLGGCEKCDDNSDGRYADHTIFKKPRYGPTSVEKWHFPSTDPFIHIKRAYRKYKQVCKGLEKQKQQEKDHEPIIAENKEREKQGKKPIPLNETKVERFVRELDEGTRIAPTAEEKKECTEKEDRRIQEAIQRRRAEQEQERIKTQESQLQSRIDNYFIKGSGMLYCMFMKGVTSYYPIGLAYNGKLVFEREDIAREDVSRLEADRIAFEQEMGRTLPEGSEDKAKWDAWMKCCEEDPEGAQSEREATMRKNVAEQLERSQGPVSCISCSLASK
ncbi:MAG: hypothetical protein Q9201_002112 [Fulgogasparrea decipioides]